MWMLHCHSGLVLYLLMNEHLDWRWHFRLQPLRVHFRVAAIWCRRNATSQWSHLVSIGVLAGDFRFEGDFGGDCFVGDLAGDMRLFGDFRLRVRVGADQAAPRCLTIGPGFCSMSPHRSNSVPAYCLQSRGTDAGGNPSGSKNTMKC